MKWGMSQRDFVIKLRWRSHRGECRLLLDDAFQKDNKHVNNISVTKREALNIETMFWHLEQKENWRYYVMVMSMTAPAHLITLLSSSWQCAGNYPPGKWWQSSQSPEWEQHFKGTDIQLEAWGLG